MPLGDMPPAILHDFRRQNIHFLLQMAAIFPVLKDPRLGTDSNRNDFADTSFHLATPAAQLRTDDLAGQILTWNVWTVEELRALGKAP